MEFFRRAPRWPWPRASSPLLKKRPPTGRGFGPRRRSWRKDHLVGRRVGQPSSTLLNKEPPCWPRSRKSLVSACEEDATLLATDSDLLRLHIDQKYRAMGLVLLWCRFSSALMPSLVAQVAWLPMSLLRFLVLCAISGCVVLDVAIKVSRCYFRWGCSASRLRGTE